MPFALLSLVQEKSKLSLAKRIREAWVELAPGKKAEIPEVVSISNRLGDLEQGKTGWWISGRREAAREAFERVAGFPLTSLPIAEVLQTPEFPRLRPLHPEAESPTHLSWPNWFELPPESKRWIIAPPGAGR